MSGIASSLEQEFADHSQAERDATLAELRSIESNGRGSVDVASHAIAMPALIGLIACGLIYGVLTRNDLTTTRVVTTLVCGVVVVAACAWLLFARRTPRFTLTEQGVRLKNGVLPWDKVEDYGVIEHSQNGLTTHTQVKFELTEGFTPPPLGLFFLFGRTRPVRSVTLQKTGPLVVTLNLFVGARGMNVDKLAERIGQFLAASRARAELEKLLRG